MKQSVKLTAEEMIMSDKLGDALPAEAEVMGDKISVEAELRMIAKLLPDSPFRRTVERVTEEAIDLISYLRVENERLVEQIDEEGGTCGR
jgi:hypothetical protein